MALAECGTHAIVAAEIGAYVDAPTPPTGRAPNNQRPTHLLPSGDSLGDKR